MIRKISLFPLLLLIMVYFSTPLNTYAAISAPTDLYYYSSISKYLLASTGNAEKATEDSLEITDTVPAAGSKIEELANTIKLKKVDLTTTTNITLEVGDILQLICSSADAEYTSVNPKIVSVDEYGTLKAHKGGSTAITAKTKKKTYTLAVAVKTAENKNNLIFRDVKTQMVFENVSKSFEELAPTSVMTFEELICNNGDNSYPEGFLAPDAYRITVDLYYQVVMVYGKDINGEYTVPIRYMLCSSGADTSPTRQGTFEMKSYRVRNSIFNNTTSYAQYWSLISGRTYFHSVLYSSTDWTDYTTTSWNNLGTNVSHGCIRLAVPDARWIWYNAAPGTVVEIREGSSSDKETAAIRSKLVGSKAKLPSTRLTGDEYVPSTDNWSKNDIKHEVGFVQGCQ